MLGGIGIGSLLIWFLAQVANLTTVYGPFWPTDPEIHPPSGIVEPSLNAFFTIKNNSAFFDINDGHFVCGIDLPYFEDANHQTGLLRDVAFATKPVTVKVWCRSRFIRV